MKKKRKEEIDVIMGHLRDMGHDFNNPDSSLIVAVKNEEALPGIIQRNIASLDQDTLSKLQKTALLALEHEPHDFHQAFHRFDSYENIREFGKTVTRQDVLPLGDSDSEYSDIYQFMADFCENAEKIWDAIPTTSLQEVLEHRTLKSQALRKRHHRKFHREWGETAV